jgi:VWFA-related protein
MRRRPSLLLSFAVLLVALAAWPQEIGQQGTDPFTGRPANPVAQPSLAPPKGQMSNSADEKTKLVFKSQTVLVQVPAIVFDKSGGHVHGLTKDDFKILENGKAQKITTFEEANAGTARPAPPANPPNTFSNLVLDGKQPLSITIVALDTINTPFLDQSNGRKQLIKYLADNLDSSHALGLVVISSKGVRMLSGLNNDPAAMIAALKRAGGESSPSETFSADGKVQAAQGQASELTGGTGPVADPQAKMRAFILNADALEGNYQQARAIEDTMKAFLEIAWSLAGLPGRKSLIWATGSFPFSLDSSASVPGGNLSVLYERTLMALNDAQVAVYPVDLRGMVGTSPTGDATYAGPLNGPGFGDNAATRSWLETSSANSLENFAEMTGGRAFTNNNDLAAGFKRAIDDSSSYYLLGYYVDTHNTQPGWRRLQVQAQRKDLEVRARSGFMVTNATLNPQLTRDADVDFALSSPFDSTGIQVTAQWQGITPSGDKKKAAFALHLAATGVIDEADKNRFDVDFLAQATQNGVPAGHAGQTVKGTVPDSSLDKIKAEGIFYRNALELPPGHYQVRFLVRDNLSGRIGTVSAPLTAN